MWIWLNSREFYYCSECRSQVEWYKLTGIGKCACRIYIPSEKGAPVPAESLSGTFKEMMRKNGREKGSKERPRNMPNV